MSDALAKKGSTTVMRVIFLHSVLVLTAFALTSCSWIMRNTIPKRPPLHTDAKRDDVIAVLGQPRQTIRLRHRENVASSTKGLPLRNAARARLRDEYFVSGLVQLPTDPYASEDNIYPAFFIITGGLIEVIAFPLQVMDLTYRSVRWRHLWLWYDSSGKLVAYVRH